MGTEVLKFSDIVADEDVQCRVELCVKTVEEYTTVWHREKEIMFPPLVVFRDSGGVNWLADGFHRYWSGIRFWENIGAEDRNRLFQVDVRPGTKRDAILYAVGANARHGLRRTNADKRKAVLKMLHDEEWQLWSDRQIAERCGVDHKTVVSIRHELESTGEIPQLIERKSADGKVRNVSNIGKPKSEAEPPPEAAAPVEESPPEPFALTPQFACGGCGEVFDAPPCPNCAPEPVADDLPPEMKRTRAETAVFRMMSEFKKLHIDDRMKTVALLVEELRDYLPAPTLQVVPDDLCEENERLKTQLTHQQQAFALLEKFCNWTCYLTAAIPFTFFGATGITEIFQTFEEMKQRRRAEAKIEAAEMLFDWFKKMGQLLIDGANHDYHSAELARRAAEEYDPDVDRDYWPEFDVEAVEPPDTTEVVWDAEFYVLGRQHYSAHCYQENGRLKVFEYPEFSGKYWTGEGGGIDECSVVALIPPDKHEGEKTPWKRHISIRKGNETKDGKWIIGTSVKVYLPRPQRALLEEIRSYRAIYSENRELEVEIRRLAREMTELKAKTNGAHACATLPQDLTLQDEISSREEGEFEGKPAGIETAIALLPCPCGTKPKLIERPDQFVKGVVRFQVVCPTCDSKTGWYQHADRAAVAWLNRNGKSAVSPQSNDGDVVTTWRLMPEACRQNLKTLLGESVERDRATLETASNAELGRWIANEFKTHVGGVADGHTYVANTGSRTGTKLDFQCTHDGGKVVVAGKELVGAVRAFFGLHQKTTTLNFKTPAPERFEITPELREWAAEKSPGTELDRETEKFLNWHRSHDEKRADWNAAWRNWMMNAVDRFASKGKPPERLKAVEVKRPDETAYITQPLDDEDAREQLEIAYLNECERIGALAFQEVPDGDRIQRVREMRGRLADQLGKPYTRMAIEAQHDRAVLSIVREIGMGKLSFEDFRSAQAAKVERKSA